MNKFNPDSVKGFMEKVDWFNTIAGKPPRTSLDDEWWLQMKNQAERVLEEAQELIDACIEKSLEKALDGVVDIVVTSLPLLPMAQAVGFNVEKGCDVVAENNITKITSDYDVAVTTAEKYGVDNCYIDNIEIDGIKYHPVKRYSDDKIMKPFGYKSVDILDCLP